MTATTNSDKPLGGKRITIGITGGIAAYKMPLLIRALVADGADVQVILTQAAQHFVTPLTLETVSKHPVLTSLWGQGNETLGWTKHVTLGTTSDLLLVCPATAHTIAKIAGGFCDDLLTATVLSARCPVAIAPAMDHDMWHHPATQANIDRLHQHKLVIIPPDHGPLASGLVGDGRMPEPEALRGHIFDLLGTSTPAPSIPVPPLLGKRAVVTAGPTREFADPVRFLSNPSTGTMGYALARTLQTLGAQVTLISGPTNLEPPLGVTVHHVTSATEMHSRTMLHKDADIVVAAAAVADYRPTEVSGQKQKKTDADALQIPLTPNADILADLGRHDHPTQIRIGFAMETHDAETSARQKMESKNCHWIVLNRLNESGAGFGKGTNRVTLYGANGITRESSLADKLDIADWIIQHTLLAETKGDAE